MMLFRNSPALRLLLRVGLNVGIVSIFQTLFPAFFILSGGVRAQVSVGLLLALLNWLVVPLLHLLSLPIKFFAWILGSLLVNAAALWLTVEILELLALPGMELRIRGGIIGWVTLSVLLGFGNWLVRMLVR